jgi:hypothetical protein
MTKTLGFKEITMTENTILIIAVIAIVIYVFLLSAPIVIDED